MLHRHTALVVDDDADTLDLLATSLTLADVHAHAVSSGREALSLVSGGLRPCAIFLDIRMPDLDGWGVRDRLQAMPATQHIPIVLVSAEMPDQERATRSGIVTWLRKPVGISDLYGALDRCCPPSH
jgi:CheY-like chemotaxis protein